MTVVSERRSEQRPIGGQCLGRLNKALTRQKPEIRVDIHRWHFQLFTLPLGRRNHGGPVQVEEVLDELVGMLSLDTEQDQCCAGKVFLIEGHDDAGIAANGGSQHMSIVDVG